MYNTSKHNIKSLNLRAFICLNEPNLLIRPLMILQIELSYLLMAMLPGQDI